MKYKVGDTVKFNNPNGSIGLVEGVHNGIYYVRWHYGFNKKGEQLTALSAINREYELRSISREYFEAYTACPAWSEEQKEVKDEFYEEG